ncbi:hypothetical protein [Streptomyces sp. NPDC059072]
MNRPMSHASPSRQERADYREAAAEHEVLLWQITDREAESRTA